MTHNLDHADGRWLPPNVEFAYDGLEVTIES